VRVALLGMGVIGAGWAVHLLARGHEVACFDPQEGWMQTLETVAERAEAALDPLGLDLGNWRERVHVATSVADAVVGADWVQENGPERSQAKSALIAAADAAAPAHVIIASSSSGTLPSSLAAAAEHHPERVIVGHPFNPVYLIPLVEVVGAPTTPAETLERARATYRDFGKRPVVLRDEVPGYLANRLQAALWREAYSLVDRGLVTVEDVDTAIASGPGLRWALLGPIANQHLSGGAGGLAHVLEHLGPPTQRWMDDLGAPQLTPELAARLVAGVEAELVGRDLELLARERDRGLVALLLLKDDLEEIP